MVAFLKKHWFKGLAGVLVTILLAMIVGNLWWGTHRLPVSFRAPEFNLTDTSGKPVTLEGLDGKIKVVTFIFTNCGESCPMTMASMMDVQDQLKELGRFGKDVVLLSITMDPERDSEQQLLNYSKNFDADLSGWMFLRGTREETNKVMETFRVPADKLDNGQYMHSNRVFLVDKNRNLRTTYDLADGTQIDKIVSDLDTLAAEDD